MSQNLRDDLVELARLLADWASDAPAYTLFVFGSRVRGDHRPNSDVDLHLALSDRIDMDSVFWKTENEEEDYKTIKARLPGALKILAPEDQLCTAIEAAPVIYSDRNVRCVLLPPKPALLAGIEAAEDRQPRLCASIGGPIFTSMPATVRQSYRRSAKIEASGRLAFALGPAL